MSYHADFYDGSIVIDGFQNGIANSPYEGIADCRNILIASTPGDAAVGFSTALVSNGTFTAITVNSASSSSGTIAFVGTTSLQKGNALSFSLSSIGGVSAGTNVYWVGTVSDGGTTCKLYSSYANLLTDSPLTISSNGTGTFYVYAPNFSSNTNTNSPQLAVPHRFTQSKYTGGNFFVDSLGQVWSDLFSSSLWTYTGNDFGLQSVSSLATPTNISTNSTATGNGIVWYGPYDASGSKNGFVFVFRNGTIDYWSDSTKTWVYGWNPSTGAGGATQTLVCPAASSGFSHEAMVAPDNRVYYCDMNSIGVFYQKNNTTAFDPANTNTYVQNTGSSGFFLLPGTDNAQCLEYLGQTLLIGGQKNVIYPWDRSSPNYLYPILVPEANVKKLITINNTCYIFSGIRGRIYSTNGSVVQIYKKIPDHISGVIDPNFIWGGATSNKNQIYFSFKAFTNAGSSLTGSGQTQYGGIWAIDLTNGALRMVNQLSYGAYSGYALALFAQYPFESTNGSLIGSGLTGTGFFAAWDSSDNATGGWGIDKTQSTPYTNSQAYLDSDFIQLGTSTKPRTFERVEYLLMKPLVSGESIKLQFRTDFSQAFTDIGTDSTVGNFTFSWPVNWNYSQWVQLRAVLNSTATNPSYVRLKQLRLTGAHLNG